MTFDRGQIQIQQYTCNKEEGFEWVDDLHNLDDPNAVSVRRIDDVQAIEQDNTENITREYREFFHLFSEKSAAKLPPHSSFDHAIDMPEGKQPPFRPIYHLSHKELEVLREYLDK